LALSASSETLDRRARHQVGDELGAVDRIELVGLGKVMSKKAARQRVPEGEFPASSITPRSSASVRSPKRRRWP
jgi:hypothetical protein